MITTTELPITQMINAFLQNIRSYSWEELFIWIDNLETEILPDIEKIELQQQAEANERCVKVLEEIIEKYSRKNYWIDGTGWYIVDTRNIESYIESITNQP